MISRRAARVVDWAIPFGFGFVLWLLTPMRTALEFGGDEGYELMKALLVSRGHPLYLEVWNDQPPLHTELLALMFRVCGPSVYAGRLLSLGFAMLLVGSLYQIVSRQSGRAAGCVAVAFVILSSPFLLLSVSVMLELPAIAMALAAVWMWQRYTAGERKWLLIASGVLFGLALQIKLTAIIFAPAFVVDYVFRRIRGPWRLGSIGNDAVYGGPAEGMLWCGGVLISSVAVMAAFYRPEAMTMMWESHFSVGTRHQAEVDEYAFRLGMFLNDPGLLGSFVGGVALIGRQRRWDLLFPVVLLVTALTVHWGHQPYWYYYDLHFAIPMAWLGGLGVVGWFKIILNAAVLAATRSRIGIGLAVAVWSGGVALILAFAPERLWIEFRKLSAPYSAAEHPVVAELRRYAGRDRWVFTDRVIYAFWADRLVPPELAVMPKKRIWSGQLTANAITNWLERYRPEVIRLTPGRPAELGLEDYLARFYQTPEEPHVSGLYTRKLGGASSR